MLKPSFPPRKWAVTAANHLYGVRQSGATDHALIAACPGAGKTRATIDIDAAWREDGYHDVTIVVCPTTHIKTQWRSAYNDLHGIAAKIELPNHEIEMRIASNEAKLLPVDFSVYCLTYAQVARNPDLFRAICSRYRVLAVFDEVHHASDDQCYGPNIRRAFEKATFKLCLSGTPFTTKGEDIAFLEYEERIGEDGTPYKITKTDPALTFDYGQALDLKHETPACRQVEFCTVVGKGNYTYRSLISGDLHSRSVNLSEGNRNDSLSPLLEPDGPLIRQMLELGIKKLEEIRQHHANAGMLVVAKDGDHARFICEILRVQFQENPVLVLHDSEKQGEIIKGFESSRQRILVTVRLVSEGVDIKRLRVGVFATNWLTRMFFNQWVGRYVRYDHSLTADQYATCIIPAHILLLEYAREIERMIVATVIDDDSDPETEESSGKGKAPDLLELTNREEEAREGESIQRQMSAGIDIKEVLRKYAEQDTALASLIGMVSETTIAGIIADLDERRVASQGNVNLGENQSSQTSTTTVEDVQKKLRDWNAQIVRRIVKALEQNGGTDQAELFRKVNSKLNKTIGIDKIDSYTPIVKLRARAEEARRLFRKVTGQELEGSAG